MRRWLLLRQTVLSLPFPDRMRPFGEDKFHIGNADKAEERGQYGVTRSVGPSLWIPPRLVIRWLFYPLPDLPDRSRYSGK